MLAPMTSRRLSCWRASMLAEGMNVPLRTAMAEETDAQRRMRPDISEGK